MSNINEGLEVNKKSVEVKASYYEENKIGNAIKGIGQITLFLGIAIGLIVGFTLSTPDPVYTSLTEPNPLKWVYGIAIIVTSFVSGVSFLGFGEIIILLDKIKKNIKI